MKKESFAQLQKGKPKGNKSQQSHEMGYVQPANIKTLTIEEINNAVDDDPNNNIVPITGVDVAHDDAVVDLQDEEFDYMINLFDRMKEKFSEEELINIVDCHNKELI